MIDTSVRVRDESKRVLAKAKQGTLKSLGHAGATIRLIARHSIRRSKTTAPAGQPPRTRRGQLRGAILYAVETREQRVVIGPEKSKIGTSGAAHEHGGKYKRQHYPRRPFMGPALEKIEDRLPAIWASSVK